MKNKLYKPVILTLLFAMIFLPHMINNTQASTALANTSTTISETPLVTSKNAKQYIIISNKINELDFNESHSFKVKAVELEDANITWTTSDSSIATISNTGKIKTKAAGTVTITATERNSGKKSVCTFRVRPKATASSYFTYRIINSKAVITSYTGPSTIKNVVIPKKLNGYTVKGLDEYSFYQSTSIKTIDFPSTISSIDDYAFYGCSSLTKLVLPASLSSLDKGAFASCTSLTYCTFPKSMKSIGDYIFNGCSSLKKVTLPTSCESVGNLIFSATPLGSLTNLQIAATMSSDIFLSDKETKVYQEMKDILASLISQKDSKVEQVRKVHDWLVLNTKYDTRVYSNTSIPEESYEAVGLILNHTAVCSGYAEAFQIFMALLDINCKVVTGTADGVNHAWNMVQLDNDWYQIDVTWDDPLPDTNKVSYSYFLITDEKLAKDHSWNAKSYPGCDGTKYMYYIYEDYICTTEKQVRNCIQQQVNNDSEWIMIVCPSSINVKNIIFEFCSSYSYYDPYTVGSYLVYRIQLK